MTEVDDDTRLALDILDREDPQDDAQVEQDAIVIAAIASHVAARVHPDGRAVLWTGSGDSWERTAAGVWRHALPTGIEGARRATPAEAHALLAEVRGSSVVPEGATIR